MIESMFLGIVIGGIGVGIIMAFYNALYFLCVSIDNIKEYLTTGE